MKKINKLIFSTTPLIYVYCIFVIAYIAVNVKFCDLLGKSVDVAGKSKSDFKRYAIEMIVVALLTVVLGLSLKIAKNYSLKEVFSRLRSNVGLSIVNKDFGEFNKNDEEYYVGSLVNDVKIIEDQYITPLLESVSDIAMLFLAGFTMFSINVECAIFVLVISVLTVFAPMFLTPKLQSKMASYMESNNKFLQEVIEQVEGYETFKNYNKVCFVKENFKKSNKQISKSRQNAYAFMEMIMASLNILTNVLVIGILIFGMLMALSGKMSIGSVFALMYMSGFVISPITETAQYIPKMLGTKKVIEKYNQICENIKSGEKKVTFDEIIKCENETLTIDDRKLLDDINVEFVKGKKYALVGGSGSGKSTLVKSLLGFYPDLEGNIYYDNDKLNDVDKNSLFDKITYLAQNSEMFEGTVRDNLTMFNNSRYSDKVLYEALELVNMKDRIDELDNGLDTVLAEKGSNFSGGEKQRIGIARALLKGNNVFVMDEITSALDYDNYLNVERILMSLVGATVISITHRLEAKVLRAYDKIFVMDKGKLVESGSFDELMDNEGYFKDLYAAQAL